MATVIDRLVTEIVFKGDAAALNRLEKGLSSISDKMNRVGRQAQLVGTALTAGAVGALKKFSDHETGMLKIATQTGKSLDVVKKEYEALVNDLAVSSGEAFTDISRGIQKAISSGFDGDEAKQLVSFAAKGAAAGLFDDIGAAVSGVTTLMQNLDLSAENAFNILAAAAQRGEGDVEDYADALKGLSINARLFGISGEEMAATLATVAQTSESVSIAKTQIESFFTSIMNETPKASKALEEFAAGTQFEGTGFQGLRDIMKTDGLAAAIATMKEIIGDVDFQGIQEKIDTLGFENAFETDDVISRIGKLFGRKEAVSFFSIASADKISDMTDSILAAESVIDKAMADAEKTVAVQFNQMARSMELVVIMIGKQLVPAFRWVREQILSLINWFNSFGETGKNVVATMLTLGPVLIGVGTALRAMAFVLSPLVKSFLWFTKIIGINKIALIAWNAIVAIATKLQKALNLSMRLNPIFLIVAGIVAIVAAIINWRKVWGWLVNLWDSFTVPNWLMLMILPLGAIVVAFRALSSAIEYLKNVWDSFKIPSWITDFFGVDSVSAPAVRGRGRGVTASVPGLSAPLPTAPAGSSQFGRGRNVNSQSKTEVKVGDITINAPGADSKEIAQNVGKNLRDQFGRLTDANDSGINL